MGNPMCAETDPHTYSDSDGESEDQNDHNSEGYTEEEEDDSEIIRAKWLFDGCGTMDEIITRLEDQIEYIKKLKNDGWELIQPVNDDYGFMRQNKA